MCCFWIIRVITIVILVLQTSPKHRINNTSEFSVCSSVNYDPVLCAGEAQSDTSYLATTVLHIVPEHGIH